jgi:cell wall-associated NlpC family hydrolase
MTLARKPLLIGVLALAAAMPAVAQSRSKGKATAHKVASKSPLRAIADRQVNAAGPFSKISIAQRDSLSDSARELLGTRYKWAGITPEKGLDCSGFVKYVFAKLGIDLPHRAAELAKMGGSVSKDTSAMQPGDLLVFGKGRGISHVGMYIGDGKMIHASSSNKSVVETSVVKYRPAGGLQWKGVRRVVSVDSGGSRDNLPEQK